MTKYCPICNRSSDDVKFFGEICAYCTIDMLKKKIPSTAKIYTCRFCGRVKAGADYERISKASLARALQGQLSTSDCKVSVSDFDIEHRRATAEFSCYEGELAFTKEVKLSIEHKTCQTCYRQRSGYYEAVIQLRGSSEAVGKVLGRLEAYVSRNGAFIAKEEAVRKGYDIYVSDKLVASGFFSYYRLKPLKSYELYGLKRGRKVYRNIYAVSLD
ncbi:MAG: 60S ribosomal export protein NMD3 [Candidatus Marsarchaeota archaeon]|jgi:NMD protein affecting ribosome stability and mRNA decay|nr:60S ribosomal export protein NMD3 [Candidatus Marsarchaeota archaeon]MCL5418937.1 60S ribosomal export protein NMD3 [Candidatus Marsarchaeota archaeon]